MYIILSDLHLGSEQSTFDGSKLAWLVETYQPEKVLIVGDSIDLLVCNRNIRFMGIFDKYKDKVVFIKGNHDSKIDAPEYMTLYLDNGKSLFLFHGHQFEKRIFKYNRILVKMNELILRLTGICIQDLIRKYTAKEYPEGKFVPALYEQRKAIIEKYKSSYDIVVTGHTHYKEISLIDNFVYANPGNWESFLTLENDGTLSFERDEAFSVEFWFNQRSMKSGSMVSHMTASPQLRGWMCQSWTGRNLGLTLCSDNGTANYLNVRTATSIFNFNTWTHACFTYDGSSQASGVKIYVNGTLRAGSVVANTLTGTLKSNSSLWVGNSTAYGIPPISIDEVVIYKRVLAQSEVTQRYNGGAGTETLFGSAYLQYHLNATSGTIVSDSSGNNRNAKTINNPSWVAGKINNCLYLDGSTQYITV